MHLWERITELMRRKSSEQTSATLTQEHDATILNLQNRVAALELERSQQEAKIQNLKKEAQARNESRQGEIDRRVNETVLECMTSIAAPLSQLVAMDSFIKSGKDITAAEVLMVAQQLLKSFSRFGMDTFGDVDSIVSYDANKQHPIGSATCRAGDSVQIKIPGVTFNEQIIRKAMVTAVKE